MGGPSLVGGLTKTRRQRPVSAERTCGLHRRPGSAARTLSHAPCEVSHAELINIPFWGNGNFRNLIHVTVSAYSWRGQVCLAISSV